MPTVNSTARRLAALPSLSVLVACLAGPAAQAQTDAAQPPANLAATWRATSRLGYAPTPDSAQAAAASPRAWALQQLDVAYAASKRPPALPAELAGINAPLGSIVRGFQAERESRKTMRETAKPGAPAAAAAGGEKFSRDMAQDAAAWRLMSCSDPALENPLLARMTEFWFNHLNVFVGKGPVRPFVGHYVVNVIRANALGRFEDLLLASAKHPAMLFYLDQAQSNSRGLNENYARELMELHTLGVNSGYTQKDVHELARVLTGWTVNLKDGEGFRFAERLHDKEGKVVLGRTFGNESVTEGEEAIRYLARRPETARRVSTRLASFFVADKPPAALIDRLAATFTSTQGDIRAVMRTLIESPEFWAKDNQLFKTPLDFACSALTASGGVKERRDIVQTLGFLAQAGQPMHGWQTPDGYKTDAATWLAPEALTRRADYAMGLTQRMAEPAYLNAFFSVATRERIAQEPAQLRAGLMLASPDFMRK
ncbi:Uncharacterized conserved protein, DUF1800 family [Polaromonas sp. YR568]|uniref:DUF1800 domain-containing protein n=1 Tax=Polaromonas sp. YR568 TaxID=1855301 RepID=UPI0008EB645D|nr:DUF1800 domain-containing protein [Polaromonas sp. YR568]SFU60195.1 Uncharacterized conserved protein, DUF1800 family [Polaromonas sp. YR568]